LTGSEYSNSTKKHKIVSIPTLYESFIRKTNEENKGSRSFKSNSSDEYDIESDSVMAQQIPINIDPKEVDVDSIESNPLNIQMSSLMHQNNVPKLHPRFSNASS